MAANIIIFIIYSSENYIDSIKEDSNLDKIIFTISMSNDLDNYDAKTLREYLGNCSSIRFDDWDKDPIDLINILDKLEDILDEDARIEELIVEGLGVHWAKDKSIMKALGGISFKLS